MKITLSDSEKKDLIKNGTMEIKRQSYMNVPKSSIISGVGIGKIFDKVDYKWVYGDTQNYIRSMINVGRRATDYPNNTKNTCNGKDWFEFPDNKEDEFGIPGALLSFGRKEKKYFTVDEIFISELVKNGEYLKLVFSIKIKIK